MKISHWKRIVSISLATVLAFGLFCTPAKAFSLPMEGDWDSQCLANVLNQFVFGYGSDSYNAENAASSHLLRSMLQNGACYSGMFYPYNTGEYEWDKRDPLGRWESYASASVQQIDWVLKNIFNCSDTAIEAMKSALPSGQYDPYVYNGYYYWGIAGIGSVEEGHIESYTQNGNMYDVVWSVRNVFDGDIMEYYRASVEAKTIDGKEYWSIHSNREASANEQPADTFWFSDVPETSWFYTPVRWATEKGIAQGRGTSFAPDDTCNVAEVLTFLWRAKGCPEPTIRNPYQNLTSNYWFYKAAVWAYQEGIYTSTASFRKDSCGNMTYPSCTRGMVTDMLWRWSGSPSAETVVYKDVASTSSYSKSVSWAVRKGITSGISASEFSPNTKCTRAQAVTFLYRYLVEPAPVTLPTGVPGPLVPSSYGSWSEAYKDFVTDENFLRVEMDYSERFTGDVWPDSTYVADPHFIALHDFDGDGTPELLINSGFNGHIDRVFHVYTFFQNKATYIGDCLNDLGYLPNSKYPGLMDEWSNGYEDHGLLYYTKVGNSIKTQTVYSFSLLDETNVKVTPGMEELYAELQNLGDSVPRLKGLYTATADKIAQMGWDAFVAQSLS